MLLKRRFNILEVSISGIFTLNACHATGEGVGAPLFECMLDHENPPCRAALRRRIHSNVAAGAVAASA